MHNVPSLTSMWAKSLQRERVPAPPTTVPLWSLPAEISPLETLRHKWSFGVADHLHVALVLSQLKVGSRSGERLIISLVVGL